jgi:hypothetical protein
MVLLFSEYADIPSRSFAGVEEDLKLPDKAIIREIRDLDIRSLEIVRLIQTLEAGHPVRPRLNAPEWMFNDAFLSRLFPGNEWKASRLNRLSCLVWYWRCGMTKAELAKALRIHWASVHNILRRANFRIQRMSAWQGWPESLQFSIAEREEIDSDTNAHM